MEVKTAQYELFLPRSSNAVGSAFFDTWNLGACAFIAQLFVVYSHHGKWPAKAKTSVFTKEVLENLEANRRTRISFESGYSPTE